MDDEYYNHLEEYFILKKTYDTTYQRKVRSIMKTDDLTMKQRRKRVKQIKMKCIGCQKMVGTVFSNENLTYSAVCGNKDDACPLDISLRRGNYVHLPDEITRHLEILNNDETDIIYEKLNLLFGFTLEDEMIQNFKELKEHHNSTLNILDLYRKTHDNITQGTQRKEAIRELTQAKNQFIHEYKENIAEYIATNQVQLLRDTIEMYISQLLPILRNLAENKYMERSVEIVGNKNPKLLGKRNLIRKQNVLIYEGVDLDAPIVQSFVIQ